MLSTIRVRFANVAAPFSAVANSMFMWSLFTTGFGSQVRLLQPFGFSISTTNTTDIAGFQARTDCLPNQCRLIVVRGLAVASGFAVSSGSGRLDLPSLRPNFADQTF
jgi:hypothetical protein